MAKPTHAAVLLLAIAILALSAPVVVVGQNFYLGSCTQYQSVKTSSPIPNLVSGEASAAQGDWGRNMMYEAREVLASTRTVFGQQT